MLGEIERLKEVEFPYSDSHDAVLTLERIFRQKIRILEQFDATAQEDAVARECAQSVGALFQYLPALGLILRSTNVRNAFEAYKPLRRLARQLLEPDVTEKDRQTKLLLSSEWSFTPYTI